MGGSLGVLQLWLSPEEICSRTVTDPVWKGRDVQMDWGDFSRFAEELHACSRRR